jgi:hypothetical protein
MTTTNVLRSTEFDGYTVHRIEFTYGSGKVVKLWEIDVPHPDVRTQTWRAQTRAEAISQGEWLKPGGGRDQATVRPALTDGPYQEYALEAVANSEVLSALYNEMSKEH